jgi:hypothetical protein
MATIRMFNNFSCGVVYGIIAALIIDFLYARIHDARSSMGQQNRTLNTFSDSEQPNLTAAKIARKSWIGTLSCIFWTLVLIAVGYGLWLVGIAIRDFNI